MIPQSWIIECLKMYKLSDNVIKFITKAMEGWKVELTAGGQALAEVKNTKRHLPRRLLITTTICYRNNASQPYTQENLMMDINLQEHKKKKINHLMYMDDIKIFAKNQRELETLIQTIRKYTQDIGMKFGIEKCAMLVMKKGKKRNTVRNRTTSPRKNKNTWRKRELQVPRHTKSGHDQTK